MSNIYSGIFGGNSLCFEFKYEETAAYFKDWLKKTDTAERAISVPQTDFDFFQNKWKIQENPYSEYSLSVYRAGNRLLEHDCCIFHGAAFEWNKIAFVFTAPSGTGKSTQLKHWLNLYGNEIKIMNGDKPVFVRNADQITVFPSPWKGKEGWGDDSLRAPLGGIIILEQGSENSLTKLPMHKSVPRLIQRCLFTVEDKNLVLSAARMIEAIVSKTPVWLLINRGDQESAVLTHHILRKELHGNEISIT